MHSRVAADVHDQRHIRDYARAVGYASLACYAAALLDLDTYYQRELVLVVTMAAAAAVDVGAVENTLSVPSDAAPYGSPADVAAVRMMWS